jgi:hypothetical protein
MKPTKPFLVTLAALVALGTAVVLPAAHAKEAAAQDAIPLSTALTPDIIDYFGVSDAYTRPSLAALVQCRALPACGASDSSRVRFLDASGHAVVAYDSAPSSRIEQVRRHSESPAAGVTETRIRLRRYLKDEQGRIVMSGVDSIVRVDVGGADRSAATLTRVHRYTDVRYLMNDPQFLWPMTGLVVLELSNSVGPQARQSAPTLGHAAVSFDGTRYAHVLTTNGLTHRVDLQAKRLETTLPDR